MIRTKDLNCQIRIAESIFGALVCDVAAGRPPRLRSSLLKDLQVIKHRLKKEGLEFCTIRLPTLGKALDRSFETGSFDCPDGFHRLRGTSLPALFSGLMKEIYTDDGLLRPDASVSSITELRQLSGIGYKLEVPCSTARDEAAIVSFMDIERDLDILIKDFPHTHPILELARTMLDDIFFGFDPKEVVPKHGPGTVATGETGFEKMAFSRLYSGIHQVYPYYEYFVVDARHLLDIGGLTWWRKLQRLDHGTSEVLLVPKDSRGPRLISREPLEFQFIQQGLWGGLHDHLRTNRFTREHVNFVSQQKNRDLCKIGSMHGNWATLDMKDASDRVSRELVKSIFPPDLFRYLDAVRSSHTKLPSGQVVSTHKFAPMGSAICFPIESVVHFVLAVSAIMEKHNLSRWDARRAVYVYGDDLIVDTRYVDCVLDAFPLVGLKFNREKCFTRGPFRESCGANFFKGVDITITRWRKPWAQRPDDGTVWGYCELASLFYQRGFLQVANLLWGMVESVTGILPVTPLHHATGYIGRKTRFPRSFTPYRTRQHPTLQSHQHYAKILSRSKRELHGVCGWQKLHKFLLIGDASSIELSDYSSFRNRWINVVSTGVP